MASIQQALCAFALTCVAATASARMVEVVYDVTTTSAYHDEWLGNEQVQLPVTAFQPITFTMSARFDVDSIHGKVGQTFPYATAYTSIFFDPASVSITATPLTEGLYAAAPANPTAEAFTDAAYTQRMRGEIFDADEPQVSEEQLNTGIYTQLRALGEAGPGTLTEFSYARMVSISQPGNPILVADLWALSGIDALAFLQSQVDIVQQGMFIEQSIRNVFTDVDGTKGAMLYSSVTSYRGDVVIRSVTTVPEPAAWMLGLLGLGLMGLRRKGRHALG